MNCIKAIILALFCIGTLHAGTVVIANGADTSVLSETALRKIYFGKVRRWDNGNPIRLTLLNEKESYDSFMESRLMKRGDQFLIYWKQLLFTGRGTMPKMIGNDQDLVNYIAQTKGAIGFISDSYDTELPGNVIVIQIVE